MMGLPLLPTINTLLDSLFSGSLPKSYFGDAIPWVIGSGRVKLMPIYAEPSMGRGFLTCGSIIDGSGGSGQAAPAAWAFCLAPATGSVTIRAMFQDDKKTTNVS